MNETTFMSVDDRPSGIKVITIAGDLDSMGTQTIQDSFAHAVPDRRSSVVVDLNQVDFISSAGMAMLLVKGKMLRQGGGDFFIAGVNDRVFEVLSLAGFQDLFNIYPTLEEALKALES
ncbi:MAG: STAS domain-containing protein [Chloroflexi bacterium]|nr:STAS domain-containing protein [Chloroflexota bacterium]